MDKKIIIANWKMLPESLAQAQEILEFMDNFLESSGFFSPIKNDRDPGLDVGIVFCPPFVFIEEVAKIIKTSHLENQSFLGAQDITIEDKAALTGEVSGPMLNNLGVTHVIIGHSERRWKLGESDLIVNKKLKSALRNGLIPIVCIGEKVHDDSLGDFIEDQVSKTFDGLSSDEISRCMIAYEPVWAISTNPGARPDTPQSALDSIKIIDQAINSKFNLSGRETQDSGMTYLYGGSVNSKNVGDFIGQKEIDGVLVGGASVNKEEFARILKVAFNGR